MPSIVETRNAVVPISSDISNAYIDFSKMTVSVVALVADVVRDGRLVVGYGFDSNGRYAAMRPEKDWLQLDCALSYGLVEYKRFLDLLPDYGFSVKNCIPHGGHQMSLNIAAGLGLGGNESYPDVFAPFGGFADKTTIENSMVVLHQSPGVGFEEKANLIATLRAATET